MQIIIYNLKFNQLVAVNKASSTVNAEVITLQKDDLHKSLEAIFNNKNILPGKDLDCDPKELMVFSGFNDDALEEFLTIYNSTNAPKIIYKAALTPINAKWSPAYLYDHLTKEVR